MKKGQTLIRNKIYSITFGIAFACVVLFAACGDTLTPPDENMYGRISIRVVGGEARTVLPQAAFDKYVYTFTKSGGAAVEKSPDKNGLFTLELGSYAVEVKAYIGAPGPYTLVASGVSPQFTVSSGNNASVIVKLNEVNAGGQGKFTYSITYPEGAAAEITLQKWPGLDNIALNPGDITNGKTQTLQLDTGSYLLSVRVKKDRSYAGVSEAVHITSSLSTVYTKNFKDDDLIATIAVLNVTLKPSTSLLEGGTETLFAEIEPPNATDKSVTWSSSNPDVAEVSENGLVTAIKEGTAKITVTTEDGNKTAVCTVTVASIAVDVTGVSMNKSSVSLDGGSTETLVAILEPSNATNQNVTWSSDNNSVATVAADGTVTAVTAGTANITVKTVDGNKTASCSVTVTSSLFTTVADFFIWLVNQSANTKDTPYAVALNLSSLDGLLAALNVVSDRYVSLDFTGSTFTSIENIDIHGCKNLTSITIGNSVTSIGNSAFNGCSSLTSVTIGNSVTNIGNSAFSGCTSLTSVTIGNSVTMIRRETFQGCTSLTSVTIGNSVTSIGDSAFRGCSSLASVTIPDSVTSIGDSAFSGCTRLASVAIGNSVISIGNSAFSGCTRLASVAIPGSVTSIGADAFYACDNLASVTIPDSVTSIGRRAFSPCKNLTAINVNAGNSMYTSENDVLYNKNKTELICYPGAKTGSFTVPDSVTSIGFSAFQGCESLASITIPDSVTSILGSAFYGCKSLANVTIPGSVTSIGENAFGFCISLASVTIGNGVTSIGNDAFNLCTSLTSVTIPNSVTSIGDRAFQVCSSLGSVTIGNSVTSIGDSAFSGCSSLASVTIPDSVSRIWDSAFRGCSSLGRVTFQGTITSSKFSSFDSFPGDLRTKYLAGGIGTYTRPIGSDMWTKQ